MQFSFWRVWIACMGKVVHTEEVVEDEDADWKWLFLDETERNVHVDS